jgi:anti-sigma factor RsiW
MAMNCRRAKVLLIDYLEGVLSQTTAAELEYHLERCLDCKRELEELKRLLTLLRPEPVPELDPGAWNAFLPEVRGRIKGYIPRVRRWVWPISAAAGVLLVLGLGWWLVRPKTTPEAAIWTQLISEEELVRLERVFDAYRLEQTSLDELWDELTTEEQNQLATQLRASM